MHILLGYQLRRYQEEKSGGAQGETKTAEFHDFSQREGHEPTASLLLPLIADGSRAAGLICENVLSDPDYTE